MDPYDWQIVKSTPLFGAMPDAAVRDIIGDHGPRPFGKGQLLFQQGQPANAFYVVCDGWVKIFRLTPEGEEAVVGVFTRGECFAEAAMFLGGQYPASAEVVSPARLLRVEGTALRRCIHAEPDLAFCMLASASRHLKLLVEQIEEIKILSGPRRVADFLARLCPRRDGSCVVDLPYEKALIANRLGMKPESFSRALAKLRPLGVSVNRDHVAISNVDALFLYAESGEMTPERLSLH
ncbi:MAG: Crp/Fnr family transcriptional regulator [Hyphomicrobiales bacterium]|nr:Crp/Fnr family transcriptional regulator [Hyphomicrobiales bacterium]